jgi:rhodanese-related sulfurtransferase
LEECVRKRDLEGIRAYYREHYCDDVEGFSDKVFKLAGVDYAIMTNIPFDSNEVVHWRPVKKRYSDNYRSALRVDVLLAGDYVTFNNTLRMNNYPVTLEGGRDYLSDWIRDMQPEYVMGSTPKGFAWESDVAKGRRIDENDLKVPGSFAVSSGTDECCDNDDNNGASYINKTTDLLSQVLIPTCIKHNLPIALKIGANRGVNPDLKAAGDGVEVCSMNVLEDLARTYTNVKFLVTFLSLTNQHDACVLTNKFPNIHLYGCWWYINNPSMIKSTTTMRLEMLGLNFTAQHSDCRVLEQLIYKWGHSRYVICDAFCEQVKKIVASGVGYNRKELRRDVKLLFGGSYELFVNGRSESKDIDSIAELVAVADDAFVIDLRDDDEKHEGMCKGSVGIPWSKWIDTDEDGVKTPPDATALPEDKETVIITHCRGGGRGGKAKVSLTRLGYKNVLNGAGPQKEEVFGKWTKVREGKK